MTTHAEKRDAQLARFRKGGPPLAGVFSAPVVGVTFLPKDIYPSLFFEIGQIMDGPHDTQWIELKREPDNEYDSNAIGVWWNDTKLGHIARPLAFRLAKELDADIEWLARVESVLISPENPQQPGLTIRLKRKE